VGGALLGLTVAFPASPGFAATGPGTSDGPAPAAVSPATDLPVDPPVGAADTTSTSTSTTTSTTSSTSTTSTSTTSTTTLPPGPPATVVLIPPLVEDDGRVEVGDAATTSRVRPRTRTRVATSSGPTLPLTGDSSFSVLAAGLGALAIGGAAVWWGSRRADPSEAAKPPARG
jgi:LPXTG-motif cell wall-anchored protein